MSPRSTTLPLYFGALSPIRHSSMTDVHQWGKMHFSALIPCFDNHFIIVSDFRQLPCGYLLKLFTLFIHCWLCIWYFHCLRASEWICALNCSDSMNSTFCFNVIFMISARSSFQSNSRGLVSFDNTSMFCLAFHNTAVGFPASCSAILEFYKALPLASEFNFLPAFFMISLNSSSLASIK